MAFGSFVSLQEVLRRYQVAAVPAEFIAPMASRVPPPLQQRLQFFKIRAPFDVSESAACEFLIVPFLQAHLDELWAALNFVFSQARQLALAAGTGANG